MVPQITGPFARCEKSNITQGTVITRSVMVNITGSLANLAMQGTQAGVWRPVEGMQLRVFGMGSDADAQIATNQLRTALIHEVSSSFVFVFQLDSDLIGMPPGQAP